VSGVATSADRVTAVRTSSGSIACDAVVFATGPWVSDLHAWLGLDVPVEPVKGELLLVRFPGPGIAHDLTCGRACLYRRRDQEIWVGGTWEHAGLDARPTAAGERILFNFASRILPHIGAAQVLRHVAGLRPVSRSGLPLAAAALGWQNVYVANGGGAKGLLLSLSIAVSIRDMLLRGTAADPGTHRAEL
jgi:glycine oxidase